MNSAPDVNKHGLEQRSTIPPAPPPPPSEGLKTFLAKPADYFTNPDYI
ncbi:MAG TPA: hypothetical protein VGO93_04105 [Candidatus Xenobia bacterium]